MKIRILRTAIIASLSLQSIPLFSQTLCWGPQLGISRAGEADRSSYYLGGVMRLQPLEQIGFEVGLNYHREEYFNDQLTVKSWPIQLSGLLFLTSSFYGTAGAGWYNMTVDFKSDEIVDQTDMKTKWHAGVGMNIPLEYSTTIVCDIRYVFQDYQFGSGLPGIKDIRSDLLILSLSILFGLQD